MSKTLMTLVGAVLALVLFFAVNILANTSLRSVRVDMTEDKLYTLSAGSRAIARDIDEDLNLYFYFSRGIGKDIPQVADYAERVRGLLKEYVRASGGRIDLAEIDPEPFSEEEDRAVQEGVSGVRISETDQLYFGLVGTNEADDREVIPFFEPNPQKERFLEYDITRLIWTLANPEKKQLGILTALPIEGGAPPANPFAQQPPSEPWRILEEARRFFDTRVLDTGDPDLSGLDVLAVIHPRGFSDEVKYAIDQWALEGKPLLVVVDPHAQADPGEPDPSNPQLSQFTAERGSDLSPLFAAWGVELTNQKFVADRENAIEAPTQDGRVVPHVFYIQLGDDNFDDQDPVTSTLKTMLVAAPGALRPTAEATTTFQSLIQTSEDAAEIDVGRIKFPNVVEMFTTFVPGYEKLTLAARVTGDVESAYPDGPPGAGLNGGSEDEPGVAEASATEEHLKSSQAPLNLIVVSDADMLADNWWIRIQRIPGTQIALQSRLSDNADFFISAVENLLGGEALTSIRARGEHSRPFDKVAEIRRDAEQRYLAEEQELNRRLRDIERQMRELEGERGQGASDELVTAAQLEQRQQAVDEMVETRRRLRDVQHNLRKDVEALGSDIKWLNVFAVPTAVALLAFGVFFVRARRRG